MYAIYNKELTGISLSGPYAYSAYQDEKQGHLNPNDTRYGAKLVRRKRIKNGIEFKFKIFWRLHWYWKPSFYWKYGTRYFHWLFFMAWINFSYEEVIDKVIQDDLNNFKINL